MTYNNQAKRYNMTKINYYASILLITIFTSSAYAAQQLICGAIGINQTLLLWKKLIFNHYKNF